jgi:hypothetical protein
MFGLGLVELALIALVVWIVVRKSRGEAIGGGLAVAGIVAGALALLPILGLLIARASLVSAEVATVAQRAIAAPMQLEVGRVATLLPVLVIALLALVVFAAIRIARQGAMGTLALFGTLAAAMGTLALFGVLAVAGAGLLFVAVHTYRSFEFVPPALVAERRLSPPEAATPPRGVQAGNQGFDEDFPWGDAAKPRIDLGDDFPFGKQAEGQRIEQLAQAQANWDAERIRANDKAYGPGGAEAKRIEMLEQEQKNVDDQRRKSLQLALQQARDEWQAAQESAREAAKDAASEFERIKQEFQRLAGMKAALDSTPSAQVSSATEAPERSELPERPERPEAPEQPEQPEMPEGPEHPPGPEQPPIPTGDEGPAAKPTAVAARPAWIAKPPASDSRNRRAVLTTDPYFTLDSLEGAAEAQLREWLEQALGESLGRRPARGALATASYAELRSQFVRSSYDESRDSSAGEATIRYQLVELPEVIPAHFVDLVQQSGRRERVAGVAAIGGSVVATLALLYGLLGIGVCENPRLGPKAPGSTGG